MNLRNEKLWYTALVFWLVAMILGFYAFGAYFSN